MRGYDRPIETRPLFREWLRHRRHDLAGFNRQYREHVAELRDAFDQWDAANPRQVALPFPPSG